MVWGGSINLKGSDYLRKLRELSKVLEILENFKKGLNPEEKEVIIKAIEIIVNYINKLSEGKT